MAIEFVQEDGTGKSDATSYASLAQYRQYWLNKGTDYSTTADDTIKAYLNSATEYIDNIYRFKGSKTDEDQALEWPRFNVLKGDSEHSYNIYMGAVLDYYDSDEMPDNLVNACCYLAAKVADGELNSTETNLRSISIGPVSKTYSGSSSSKSYSAVDKFLKNLILTGNKLVRVN